MTLQVPIEQFFAEAAARCPGSPIYASVRDGWTYVTTVDNSGSLIVGAVTRLTLTKLRERVSEKGVELREGTWMGDSNLHTPDESADCYLAAVSYATESGPGVWVDAYAHMPTQVQVLRSMYDELCETGELSNMDFEAFTRLAKPNVAIVSPREVEGYLERNAARELV